VAMEVHWNCTAIGISSERFKSRRRSKGSVSHIATTRQLEGAGRHSCPGGGVERLWRAIGTAKPFGKRLSVSRGNVETAPYQRVSVAHCDHTTAGRRRIHFWTRRLRRASKDVHGSRQVARTALQLCKMRDGVLASSLGHCRTLRPKDTGKAPDAILDSEALEGVFGGPLEYRSRLDGVYDVEEARWSRSHSKGSRSPSATIRQLEGARRHS